MIKVQTIKGHFRKQDPIISAVVEKMNFNGMLYPVGPDKYFEKLCGTIVNQQLSSKAADTILGRFLSLFPDKKITSGRVLKIPDQKIRYTGISRAKVKYIKNLAMKIENREVEFDKIHLLDDEAVILELTKIKGIGRWTAEMFLMFTLGRENIFSHGDLGLRKAIKKLYEFNKDPSEGKINKIVEKWVPYKTYGSIALWSIFD